MLLDYLESGVMGYRPITKNNYDLYECMSAMQKCIRRGQTIDALYWAFEMAESGFLNACLERLKITSYEDIGNTDMQVVLYANQAISDVKHFNDSGKDAWKLPFTGIVVSLSQAKKSRDNDNLIGAITHARATQPKKPIPDFALDKHTIRGKQLGRGMEHFLKEGAKLEPDHSNPEFKALGETGFMWMSKNPQWKSKDIPQGSSKETGEIKLSDFE